MHTRHHARGPPASETIVRRRQATALGARGEVAHRDLQPGPGSQGGELGLPRAGAVAVGAARVRGDQQPPGQRIVAAPGCLPPAADRLHGERGGVVVGADVHPAGVRRQVIDPVRDRLAQLPVREVVGADPGWLALRPPLPAAVFELADQFLLLGVHADHGVPGRLVLADLPADVTELRVPVRVLLSLDGLGVALQAEPLGPQQIADGVRRDLMTLGCQLGRQLPRGLRRPPQRRHRVAPLLWLNKGKQRRAQPRIQVGRPLAAPARPPRPAQRPSPRIQLSCAQRHRRLPDPGRPGHQPDPAMPQRPGLGAHQQPPLPLIQMREDHLELRRQHLPGYRHDAHTTTACPIPGSYGLILCDS